MSILNIIYVWNWILSPSSHWYVCCSLHWYLYQHTYLMLQWQIIFTAELKSICGMVFLRDSCQLRPEPRGTIQPANRYLRFFSPGSSNHTILMGKARCRSVSGSFLVEIVKCLHTVISIQHFLRVFSRIPIKPHKTVFSHKTYQANNKNNNKKNWDIISSVGLF